LGASAPGGIELRLRRNMLRKMLMVQQFRP
jgi:hypothetical protein